MQKLIFVIASVLVGSQALALDSQCYPNTPEAQNWPVCVIYLHGLHPASDQGSYTKYEAKNRPLLSQFTDDYLMSHHCRLSAPVAAERWIGKGKKRHRAKYLNWQHRTLDTVETAARNACGGKNVILEKGRVLVGFSAGGWEAYHLGMGNCDAVSDYSQIIGIGLPLKSSIVDNRIKRSCPNLRIYPTHDFPGQFSEALQLSIANSLPTTPKPYEFASGSSSNGVN
jgi:hypothetical protein